MKLLIVSNCNYPIPITIEQCKTRNELFVYLFKVVLNNFDDIEVIVAKCYPYLDMKSLLKNQTINIFPVVDHTLFIDDYGFHKKHQTFIDQLKMHTKYSISSLLYDTKFSNAEDITFTFNILNKQSNNKIIYIKPPLDEYIYAPRKDNNVIYILLNKPSPMMRETDTDITFILSKIDKLISKNNDNDQDNKLVFKIGIIDFKSVNYVDTRGTTIETKNFNAYIDFVYEISKATIFILTNNFTDIYFLYELAMCNTLTITKVNTLTKFIIDELKIYTYNYKLKWDEIFDMLMTHNIREFLITNDYSWVNMLNTMIDKLKTFSENQLKTNTIKTKEIEKETNNKSTYKINNRICVLNIKDRNKPHIYTMKINETPINTFNQSLNGNESNITSRSLQSNQSNQINQKDKKLPIFLQSQLLK